MTQQEKEQAVKESNIIYSSRKISNKNGDWRKITYAAKHKGNSCSTESTITIEDKGNTIKSLTAHLYGE